MARGATARRRALRSCSRRRRPWARFASSSAAPRSPTRRCRRAAQRLQLPLQHFLTPPSSSISCARACRCTVDARPPARRVRSPRLSSAGSPSPLPPTACVCAWTLCFSTCWAACGHRLRCFPPPSPCRMCPGGQLRGKRRLRQSGQVWLRPALRVQSPLMLPLPPPAQSQRPPRRSLQCCSCSPHRFLLPSSRCALGGPGARARTRARAAARPAWAARAAATLTRTAALGGREAQLLQLHLLLPLPLPRRRPTPAGPPRCLTRCSLAAARRRARGARGAARRPAARPQHFPASAAAPASMLLAISSAFPSRAAAPRSPRSLPSPRPPLPSPRRRSRARPPAPLRSSTRPLPRSSTPCWPCQRARRCAPR